MLALGTPYELLLALDTPPLGAEIGSYQFSRLQDRVGVQVVVPARYSRSIAIAAKRTPDP